MYPRCSIFFIKHISSTHILPMLYEDGNLEKLSYPFINHKWGQTFYYPIRSSDGLHHPMNHALVFPLFNECSCRISVDSVTPMKNFSQRSILNMGEKENEDDLCAQGFWGISKAHHMFCFPPLLGMVINSLLNVFNLFFFFF